MISSRVELNKTVYTQNQSRISPTQTKCLQEETSMLTGEQIMIHRSEHAYSSLIFEQRCRKEFGFA